METNDTPQLQWMVYIVECADGTWYTGCTNDVSARIATHNNGTGAKYTRSRLPVRLVYTEKQKDRSEALKREAAIKKLSKKRKTDLL